MRIAMFTNTYAPLVGGIEKSVATFAQDLNERGHRTLVVTPAFEGHRMQPGVFRMPAIQRIGGTAFSLRLPFCTALTRHLERFRPDVIHCHQPFMLGDTALRYARRFGVPLVFTHHTLYERYADQWAPNQDSAYRLAVHLPTEFANLCDLVITPTPSVAQIIRERGVTAPIAVAPTGIDTHRFGRGDRTRARRRWGLGADAYVIGHVGRLIPAKNMDFLAEAIGRALADGPAGQRLLLVGEGASLDPMRQAFERFGVADRVIATGNLDGRELVDAYAAMDAFAFASKTDTQGLVLVEAMAAGVPVVALDAPGPRDVVVDGEHGRLLPIEATPDAFAGDLAALREAPAVRQRWSDVARLHAERYSHQACTDRLVRIYTELTADRPEPAPITPINQAMKRLRTEWALLAEKARIAAATVTRTSREEAPAPGADAPR